MGLTTINGPTSKSEVTITGGTGDIENFDNSRRRTRSLLHLQAQVQLHPRAKGYGRSPELRFWLRLWILLNNVLFLCLFLLSFVRGSYGLENGSNETSTKIPGKIPVIIDTDPGIDDVLVMLLALASPEIEILGIVVTYGNTDLESAYNNTLKMYNALHDHFDLYPDDKKRFPNFGTENKPLLARGPAVPLEGGLRNTQYFDEGDGLGHIDTLYPDITTGVGAQYLNVTDKPGHEVVLDLLRSYPPRSINYIALGPLTNLALAAREDPTTLRDRVGRVIIMGGSLDVPGNTNPVAEYNIFNDPFAAKELVEADPSINSTSPFLPLDRVLLIPLDITSTHTLFYPTYTSLVDPSFIYGQDVKRVREKYPLTYFTSAFLQGMRAETIQSGGRDALELYDLVAMWCAIVTPPQQDIESGHTNTAASSLGLQNGWESTNRVFQVERFGEITRGMLVVDRTQLQSGLLSTDSNNNNNNNNNNGSTNTGTGVPTITRTPGEGALVASMIARIWGCCLTINQV